MTNLRVSAVSCLVALAACSAFGQSFKEPQYTSLPATYAEFKIMDDETKWYLKAWADPLAVMKQDPATAAKILGLQSWDVKNLLQQPPEAARLVVGKSLVSKVGNDPYFEATLQIARIDSSDSIFCIQSTQVLADALGATAKQYPNVKEPSKKILLAKLDDARPSVKYVAITGLGLLGDSPSQADVVAVLIKQLGSNDDAVVGAAAAALASLGDTSAIRPLITEFQKLPENVDATADTDEGSTPGMIPSQQPINQTRLSIAIAVDKLGNINLGFSALTLKDDILSRYSQLNDWWEVNKDKYP